MADAARIDFEKEIELRREEQNALQTKFDQEEIQRRMQSVKDGQSKLIPANEMWDSLDKMGY